MLAIFLFLGLAAASCPTITPVPNLNITEYTRATWYIQKQQLTGYQSKDQLFCTIATYNLEKNRTVPFFKGTVVSVYNYANQDEVNGKPTNPGMVLCARVPDADTPSKLLVAPCFLPNILAGPYWVVAIGGTAEHYEWVIISGGQPTQEFPDGCTTKTTGVNGSGLWFATRAQVPSDDTIVAMDKAAHELGYTLSQLLPVQQVGCKYDGAKVKADILLS